MSGNGAIAFAGSQMDRADHIRSDPERLDGLKNPEANLLLLDGLAPVLDADGKLAWGRLKDASEGAELVFLGMRGGVGCFAAVPAEGSTDPAYSPQEAMRKTWAMIGLMSEEDLAIYGGARSLVDWHARHRFCAKCGNPTVLAKGGWQRNCTNEACKGEHFPRVDPVTIMLVEHDGKLLLGRQPRFPPRRFSALAGFIEPGEGIEEAVAREVFEEAGIRVREISYIASQPWPFPSQLMIGCHAHAESAELNIDTTELEEAHWFTREEIAAAMAGDEDGRLLTPPPVAIAHSLLEWWLDR